MNMLLVSFPIPFPEAVEAACTICQDTVYEQAANLERVEREDGFVICLACAIGLKVIAPDRVPQVEGQLWEGHVRKPVTTTQTQPLLDFLNRRDG